MEETAHPAFPPFSIAEAKRIPQKRGDVDGGNREKR
jgi:hypothetical protein